jgi:hypothetical protein
MSFISNCESAAKNAPPINTDIPTTDNTMHSVKTDIYFSCELGKIVVTANPRK